MLQKIYRLNKKIDFDRIWKSGKIIKDDFIFLKYTLNNLNRSRFGFIISSKNIKKAVKRNLFKRRLRAVINGFLSRIKPGFDVVIMPNSEIAKKSYLEIKNKLQNIFRKNNIIQ